MRKLRGAIACLLTLFIGLQPAEALPFGAPADAAQKAISLPQTLGYISEVHSPRGAADRAIDIILIQNLHVNRSVQFAISGILKNLKAQGYLPDAVAVEGEAGTVDLGAMQRYSDPAVRKKAADYLVNQGEMPGAFHFVITQGRGDLFGVESEAYYQANLEMFRRSFESRRQLLDELLQIQGLVPRLRKIPSLESRAATLEIDIEMVRKLIEFRVVPDELSRILNRAGAARERLESVVSNKVALAEPLSAALNFYALALLRDEEMFKNAMAMRQQHHQKTSVIVTGGFHTQGLAAQCKRVGLSYVVITPVVKRHNKTDEALYIDRLMGRHLTPDQVRTGQDWTATHAIEPRTHLRNLFPAAASGAVALGGAALLTGLLLAFTPHPPGGTSAAALTQPSPSANGIQRPPPSGIQMNPSIPPPVKYPQGFRELTGSRMLLDRDGTRESLQLDQELLLQQGQRIIFYFSAANEDITVRFYRPEAHPSQAAHRLNDVVSRTFPIENDGSLILTEKDLGAGPWRWIEVDSATELRPDRPNRGRVGWFTVGVLPGPQGPPVKKGPEKQVSILVTGALMNTVALSARGLYSSLSAWLISLWRSRTDRRRRLAGVQNGLQKWGRSVGASANQIIQLSTVCVEWIKTNPVLQARVREQMQQMAAQAAVTIAA